MNMEGVNIKHELGSLDIEHVGFWKDAKPNELGRPVVIQNSTPIGENQFYKLWLDHLGDSDINKRFEDAPTGCYPESHNASVREIGMCYQCGRDWFI